MTEMVILQLYGGKFSLDSNLKQCWFYQEKIQFFGYVVSSRGICIENKKIKIVKQWPEPQLIRDIQVFLGFANFYQRFIQEFSRIAALFILMLKISKYWVYNKTEKG